MPRRPRKSMQGKATAVGKVKIKGLGWNYLVPQSERKLWHHLVPQIKYKLWHHLLPQIRCKLGKQMAYLKKVNGFYQLRERYKNKDGRWCERFLLHMGREPMNYLIPTYIGDVMKRKPELASKLLHVSRRYRIIESAPQPSTIILMEGDYFDRIKQVPDDSINVLFVDPPYSVMEDYDWDKKDEDFYHRWLSTITPKFKALHSGFIFGDARNSHHFESILNQYFSVKNRIIWRRTNMSMGRVVKDRFISSYEVIFYFGTRPLNFPKSWGGERFDSCEYAVPQSNYKEGKLHPTQKPLALVKQILSVGSYPGDTILDSFAGSGTTGAACQKLGGRTCILIEKEPLYCKTIKQRLGI